MALTRRRALSTGSAALAGLLLSGVGTGQDTGDDAVDDEALQTLGESVTAFGLDLNRQIAAESPAENALVSPYSASISLAMTWMGALGETADQMAETLRYPYDQERLHPTFGALDERIDPPEPQNATATPTEDGSDDREFSLETANAMWGQDGFPFVDTYLEELERHYGAGMRLVDFESDPSAAVDRINDWVAEQTEDTIERLLRESDVDDLTRFVLTNAVYFAASWTHPFDEDLTEPAPFTSLDGSTSEVPMMTHSGTVRLPYAEVDGTQAVSLPYDGGDVDMVVLLPPAGEFEAVEADLDIETLRSVFDALGDAEGRLRFPKFEYETRASLKETLSAMGMERPFTERADFRGMTVYESLSRLRLQDVVQKTYVSVDEQGTEASAATAVVGGVDSAPRETFEMTVDRPFLYVIRHKPTNTALFLGRVVSLDGEPVPEGPPVIGDGSTPTDPDDDGLYEDLNGNGGVDYDDVVTYFDNMDQSAMTDHVQYYDYNGNGELDYADLVDLFEQV